MFEWYVNLGSDDRFFSCETKFWMDLSRICYQPKQRSTRRSIFRFSQSFDHALVSVQKKGIGTNMHLANLILL